MVLATVAVAVREYRVGRERLVDETYHTLQVNAGVAAERLGAALAERARLTSVWAGLETSQDLAVDDVDKRLSGSLAELAGMLDENTQAVAMRLPDRLLSASDPARLAGTAPPLPAVVLHAVDAPRPGLTVHGSGSGSGSGDGTLVSTADVVSRVDGGVLGRVAVWTPLERFLAGALPLELRTLELRDASGAVLFRGADVRGSVDDYLWARDTTETVAGPLSVGVARARAEVTAELRASGTPARHAGGGLPVAHAPRRAPGGPVGHLGPRPPDPCRPGARCPQSRAPAPGLPVGPPTRSGSWPTPWTP